MRLHRHTSLRTLLKNNVFDTYVRTPKLTDKYNGISIEAAKHNDNHNDIQNDTNAKNHTKQTL